MYTRNRYHQLDNVSLGAWFHLPHDRNQGDQSLGMDLSDGTSIRLLHRFLSEFFKPPGSLPNSKL